jgi:hypothetical protein
MKKTTKKLALRKEVVRALANTEMQVAAGGISGLRNCHSLTDDKCGGGGSVGVLCTQSGAPNCTVNTGVGSQCNCVDTQGC